MFTAFKLTNNGKALHIKSANGDSIKFTKVGFGDGSKPNDYLQITELNNIVTSVPFVSYDDTNQNILNLKWELDTSKILKSFKWSEYGLYAKDKDGNEILYAYAYDENPVTLTKMEQGVISLYIGYVTIAITDTDDITVAVGEYDTVTVNQFKEHTENQNNPHNVTAEQIGLGNVVNASPSEVVPEFNEAKRLENVISGEKTSTLWGKVKKAISSLLNHMADRNNPHNVTTTQIGAAKTEHNHSACDITSGVLDVERGGTGVSSFKKLKEALDINLPKDYSSEVIENQVLFKNFYNTQFCSSNGIATVAFTCQIKNGITKEEQTGKRLLTLPYGMRPSKQLSMIGLTSGKEIFTAVFSPDGSVMLYSFGSINIPAESHLRVQATYLVA